MSESGNEIKPAKIYADLSAIEIAEMLAEAAEVDALFASGRISTLHVSGLSEAVRRVADARAEKAVEAA